MLLYLIDKNKLYKENKDSKMILLDTNVLYRLARIEECKKYDRAKVESFVDQHTCFCAKYSFFELLNSNFSPVEKNKVLKYMKDHRINVSTDPEIMKDLNPEWQKLVKDEAYYNRLKKIYGEHIYDEVVENTLFFVICYPYMCLTVYLDNALKSDPKGREYFRKKSASIQKEIDRYIKKNLMKTILKSLDENTLCAKDWKEALLNFIANIMYYYHQLINYANELITQKSSAFYYRIIKKFKSLKAEILKAPLNKKIEYDYHDLSILNVLINAEPKDPRKASLAKKAFSKMIRDSIYYVNKDLRNSFEEVWLQRELESLLLNGGKIDKNDFMDYGVMREAYYCKSVRTLLTFDDKIIKIMGAVKDSDLFQNSVKTINSFKTEAI